MRSQPERNFIVEIAVTVFVPVFIMLLVGSLVYFLLDIRSLFFEASSGRLKFVIFNYIIGCVLINRVAALYGEGGGAGMYALLLGGVMLLFMWTFSGQHGALAVEVPLFGSASPFITNVIIVAVIWWTSNKLTKECCIDKPDEVAAGQGLVTTVRGDEEGRGGLLDRFKARWPQKKKKGKEEDRERLPKKHPGISVVYYSIAALILFGIGQQVVPSDQTEIQTRVFLCMFVFVLSALALLLLTSLSGLRHYFAEKKVEIPPGVGFYWVAVGAVVILAVAIFADFLPRPPSTIPMLRERIIAPEAIEGRFTISRSPISGDRLSDRPRPGRPEQTPESAAPGQEDQSQGTVRGQQLDEEGRPVHDDQSQEEAGDSAGDSPGQGQGTQGQSGQGDQQRDGSSGRQQQTPQQLAEAGGLVKKGILLVLLVAGAIIALVVLGALLRAFGGISLPGLGFLSFIPKAAQRLRDLIGRLFRPSAEPKKKPKRPRKRGKRGRVGPKRVADASVDFRNPFLHPALQDMAPNELVDYSYEALMAFARDLGCPRYVHQTPLEFSTDLPEPLLGLWEESNYISHLYTHSQYSDQFSAESQLTSLKEFWSRLDTARRKSLRASR